MIIRKFIKNKKGFTLGSSKGFSLVETLVALAILLVAVVGPISLIGDSLHKIYYARDEMVAINLAQEGVEVVRQMKDSNMLSAVAGVPPWDSGLAPTNYIVDAWNSSAPLNSNVTDKKVYIDAITGLYRQGVAGTATQFTREVVITDVVPGVEKNVTSTVTWKTGGSTGTLSVSENIFNWAQ